MSQHITETINELRRRAQETNTLADLLLAYVNNGTTPLSALTERKTGTGTAKRPGRCRPKALAARSCMPSAPRS